MPQCTQTLQLSSCPCLAVTPHTGHPGHLSCTPSLLQGHLSSHSATGSPRSTRGWHRAPSATDRHALGCKLIREEARRATFSSHSPIKHREGWFFLSFFFFPFPLLQSYQSTSLVAKELRLYCIINHRRKLGRSRFSGREEMVALPGAEHLRTGQRSGERGGGPRFPPHPPYSGTAAPHRPPSPRVQPPRPLRPPRPSSPAVAAPIATGGPMATRPPPPPPAPLTPPSPFCAAEGAGSSAAVSSSKEKAAGSGPERGILPAAEGSEAGGREGRKEGGEAAPAPSFSADLLPQRSAGSLDATGGSRESWAGRPRSGRRGGVTWLRSAGFAFPPQAPSCARFEMGLVVRSGC